MSKFDTFFSFDALYDAPASNVNATTRRALFEAVAQDPNGRFEPLVAVYDNAEAGGHARLHFPNANSQTGVYRYFSTNHTQHTWAYWHPALLAPEMVPGNLYHWFCVRQPTDNYKNLFPLVCVRIWTPEDKHNYGAFSKQAMGWSELGHEAYADWCVKDNRAFREGR